MRVILRKTMAQDIPMIYRWRNDPRIRKWLFASKKIPWKEHVQFWKKRLRQRGRYSYIVQVNDRDCGATRLDPNRNKPGWFEIDIYLDPDIHGKGIGSAVLKELQRIAGKKRMQGLTAAVKPENTRSQRIFEKNGFRLRYQYTWDRKSEF